MVSQLTLVLERQGQVGQEDRITPYHRVIGPIGLVNQVSLGFYQPGTVESVPFPQRACQPCSRGRNTGLAEARPALKPLNNLAKGQISYNLTI